MSAAPIRVVVVDDQPAVRDGFARIVQAQADMELVAVGVDGMEAVELSRRVSPDVIVMDVRMPRMDGIEATRAITSANGDATGSSGVGPRVLVVTTFSLDEYVYDALRAGASGFLLKDSTPEQLLTGIRTVARGEALIAPSVTRALIGTFAERLRPATAPDGMDRALTSREREVLELLARGMSNSEIADELFVTRETVKTYVSRILAKLQLRDRVQAVVYAYRNGIADP